jgi:hypothetical protein
LADDVIETMIRKELSKTKVHFIALHKLGKDIILRLPMEGYVAYKKKCFYDKTYFLNKLKFYLNLS